MARDIVQICNEALSDLPAHPITGLDDTRKEARECARFIQGVVSDLIDDHDYDFVERRAGLAEVVNDRANEWAYAYALPDEIVSPIQLVRSYDSSSVHDNNYSSVGLVVTPVLWWPVTPLSRVPIDYVIGDGKLYSNLELATLEYTFDTVEPNKWPPLFAQAVIRLLASRIYRPILGEKADTQEWMVKQQAAQRARDEAVASDLNRRPRNRQQHMSDAEIARRTGWGLTWPM